MTSSEIAARLEKLNANYSPLEISRLCTLFCNLMDDTTVLRDEQHFSEVWDEVNLRLSAATDQHAAMMAEVETLANSDPQKFTQDQVWILVRAIKVQSQMLRLYAGDPDNCVMI